MEWPTFDFLSFTIPVKTKYGLQFFGQFGPYYSLMPGTDDDPRPKVEVMS